MASDHPPAFLFGAGVSVAAGLPVSKQLTKLLLDVPTGRARLALNFVVAAMTADDARDGGSATQLPDIERVASAVELLTNRASLEVSPFISSWDRTVEGLGTESPRPVNLRREIDSAFGVDRFSGSSRDQVVDSSRLANSLERAIYGATQRRDSFVFYELHQALIDGISSELAPPGPDVSFMWPLMRYIANASRTVALATLNYDLLVEIAAKQVQVECSTGVEYWTQTGTIDFHRSQLELIKLHGSLNWHSPPASGRKLIERDLEETIDVSPWPFLVFGQREKLRPSGPFLQLLEYFRTRLFSSDELVVCGYGFRDDHINELIGRWLETGPGRKLFVVDPGFPLQQEGPLLRTYRDRLLEHDQVDILRIGADQFFTALGDSGNFPETWASLSGKDSD